MSKRTHIGKHKSKRNPGDVIVRAHQDGYEITFPHPSGQTERDGQELHGGKVTCNEAALLEYLGRHAEGYEVPE